MLTVPRFQVWGDPIAHSLSPRLHRAAYAAMGVDWRYDRRRVDADAFAGVLAGLDADYRGLSLTMPLKAAAFAAAATRDRRAQLTGAVNTLLLDETGPHGFNTDIGGLVRDLHEHGLGGAERVRIVGSGATATSALVALAELGVARVDVAARHPERTGTLTALGERLHVTVAAHRMDAPHDDVPLTLAALPGGASVPAPIADALAGAGGTLYDVVYAPWPTDLARAWARTGRRVVAGRGMLLQQALLQVRVFHHDDPDAALPGEAAVLDAMRAALDAV